MTRYMSSTPIMLLGFYGLPSPFCHMYFWGTRLKHSTKHSSMCDIELFGMVSCKRIITITCSTAMFLVPLSMIANLLVDRGTWKQERTQEFHKPKHTKRWNLHFSPQSIWTVCRRKHKLRPPEVCNIKCESIPKKQATTLTYLLIPFINFV